MQILVIGDQQLFTEVKDKFGAEHDFFHFERLELVTQNTADVVIDLATDESPENFEMLLNTIKADLYLCNTVKTTLSELYYIFGAWTASVAGFNGLPGFINREAWEVTSLDKNLPALLDKLPGQYIRVEDRVGMVTPRVICMIINEACFTNQEGTASQDDIDKAMKLGTAYPHGPFEWLDRIGINHVYELLEALYEDTRDERYKICPGLKKAYQLLG